MLLLILTETQKTILIIAWVLLAVLIFVILYRFLLAKFKKGQIDKKLYFILSPVENNPANGIISIFIEMHYPMEVEISIFSIGEQEGKIIESKQYEKGGSIVQLDTRELENGVYFYQAKSNNQKTRKRIVIEN